MVSRHRSRELAIQMTYQFTMAPMGMADPNSIQRFWDEQAQSNPKVRDYFEFLVRGVAQNLPMLDQNIEKVLQNWRFDRLDKMDMAILRVSAFEILCHDTPVAVVINEALELSKKYCNQDSPKFINGTLDAIAKTREPKPA